MSGIPDSKVAGSVRPGSRYIKHDKILLYNVYNYLLVKNIATKRMTENQLILCY